MREEKKTIIGEKTLVSLHFVVTLIGVIIWTVKLDDKVTTHEKVLLENKESCLHYEKIVTKLDRRLYILETKLRVKDQLNEESGD